MSALDMFWAAPPITRTIVAATVLVSIPGHLMGIPDFYWLLFTKDYVFTVRTFPQVWRLVTNFLITGPKLGMILDPYFLYTYCSSLEMTASRFSQPGDFLVYLVFVNLIILLLGGVYLGGFALLNPLTLALAYTYAQENPNMQLNYFVVTFSAKWLPYVMLIGTVVMASPYVAVVQASGLVAAHAYDFVTIIWPQHGGGRKWLNTPLFVQRWFAKPAGSASQRGAGTAFNVRAPAGRNAPPASATAGRGWTSGFSGGAWGQRGTGRRLGGD
ncbi:hypothetical protein LTR37_005967 [Vermiconidia calcicola]|uniref:Uncharacterized protein n=1 Tax=Vermiconidia calcicola TaxID=1690605 RepID=A0ACC3NI16_9PEZI|nr:hypothetical protein LTR37_005967 [Vermiconidia calcicola]